MSLSVYLYISFSHLASQPVFLFVCRDNVSWDEDKLAEAQKKVEANSSQVLEQHMQGRFWFNEVLKIYQILYADTALFHDKHSLVSTKYMYISRIKISSDLDAVKGACSEIVGKQVFFKTCR